MARNGIKTGGGSRKGIPNKAKSNFAVSKYLEEFVGVIKNDSFYVYKHEINGVCFYIGKGKASRAWSISGRNFIWNEFVNSIGRKYDIRLIAMGLTEEEAFIIESELIKLNTPKCNINGIIKDFNPSKIESIR